MPFAVLPLLAWRLPGPFATELTLDIAPELRRHQSKDGRLRAREPASSERRHRGEVDIVEPQLELSGTLRCAELELVRVRTQVSASEL